MSILEEKYGDQLYDRAEMINVWKSLRVEFAQELIDGCKNYSIEQNFFLNMQKPSPKNKKIGLRYQTVRHGVNINTLN